MNKEDVMFFRLFGSIFAGVGSIFLIVGIIFGVTTHASTRNSIKTQGTVIDVVQYKAEDDSENLYYPVIIFARHSNRTTVFEGDGSFPPAYVKGQQVEVLYNPQQPELATIYSWIDFWLFPTIFTGVGLVAITIGGIPLFKSFFPKK